MTQTAVSGDFSRLADPYRRELLAHCYRMLGSAHDAEDLVQETYLRAWRSYESFQGRSSLRTWLYRIATNTCLSELESRGRRALPTGLGGTSTDPDAVLVERPELDWLEPFPSATPAGHDTDPASVVVAREGLRLALIAALQYLPPRQRAVLVLRDVLRWRASEVAAALGTTTAAVNSLLQRARSQLGEAHLDPQPPAELTSAQRELLERYVAAFEAKDIAAIVELFTADALWEMPPFPEWFRGAGDIGRLVATQCPAGPGDMRLLATEANGHPAFAVYRRDAADVSGEEVFREFQMQVLHLDGARVRHVVTFFEPGLFARFGLPAAYVEGYPTDGVAARVSTPATA